MITEIEFANIAEQVKEIMSRMNYQIHDKGLPELVYAGSEVFGESFLVAAYAPTLHTIFVNTTATFDEKDLPELLAHELTHAYQDMSGIIDQSQICLDPTLDEYWEQEYERQAYSIGGIFGVYQCADEVGVAAVERINYLIANDPLIIIEESINQYRKIFNNFIYNF